MLFHIYSTKKSGVIKMKQLLRKLVCLIIVCVVGISGTVTASADEPVISAYAYSLYCVNTGEFLLTQNADEHLPMASTTKIMTAILGIEMLQSDKEETIVTVTPDMYAEGSSMYLASGEQILMSDLVSGMLMVSGNDAANAISLTVGGSTENFAKLMNKKAAEIGLDDTNFVTPSGLDAQGHYTTACDLAKLMSYCMENSLFRQIDRAQSVTVNFITPQGKTQTYYNENRLLREYEYCIAGKTGYTDKAGRTLVSCAEKDGIRLIAVTLNDGDDWNDHKKMFDYGFGMLSMEQLDMDFTDLKIPVVGGTKNNIEVAVGAQPSVCADSNGLDDVEAVYCIPKFVYAPIAKGNSVGTIKYYKNGVYAGQSEVTADETAAYMEQPTKFTENVVSFFKRMFIRK